MSKTQVFKIANTVFLVCFFLFSYSFAQSPQLLTLKQKQLQLNKIQVNDLLRYIEEDSKKVDLIDSSLLHVRLGDILWESNKEKSQIEFKAAVNQLVKAISEFQEVKDGGKYKFDELIAVSSNLLENISGKNKQLEEILVNEMIGLADKKNLSSQKKSQLLSNALAQAALGFIKNDKKRAFELGLLAIAWGDGEQILSFWNSLIIEDNQLSKDFYDRYLTQAEIKPVSEAFHSIGNLGYMLFPATLISPSIIEDKDLYSKSRQTRYLKLLSTIFQNNPENACYSVGLVIKLSNRYDEILPSETPILRILLDKCKSKSYFQDLQGNQLKTYDDYLSEANKIEDIKLRTIYLLRAAQIALQQSLYVKSIEISTHTKLYLTKLFDSGLSSALRRFLDNG